MNKNNEISPSASTQCSYAAAVSRVVAVGFLFVFACLKGFELSVIAATICVGAWGVWRLGFSPPDDLT